MSAFRVTVTHDDGAEYPYDVVEVRIDGPVVVEADGGSLHVRGVPDAAQANSPFPPSAPPPSQERT